ncbi:MAG: hypothetical protein ABEH88_01430 [Halobacteriales archaeon]
MVERSDPGRAGVIAGRLVGVITGGIAAASLIREQSVFYESLGRVFELVGVGGLPVSVLFWANVGLAFFARYGISYVVGSLVGVLYDWLDRPSWPVVAVIALWIGLFDAGLAFLDTFSPLTAGGYVFAWLCFVPVFAWFVDDDAETRSGPRRLGEE